MIILEFRILVLWQFMAVYSKSATLLLILEFIQRHLFLFIYFIVNNFRHFVRSKRNARNRSVSKNLIGQIFSKFLYP